MVIVRGRLAPEVGAVLVQALTAAREALYQQARGMDAKPSSADISAETPTMAQQQADALALIAETALHHGIDPGAPSERYQVVVHVDAPVLADPDAPGQSVLEDGAHVSAETARRLACDASRVVMRHGLDGRVVEVAARTRAIPPALRRALHHRDRGCRFPGCGLRFGQGHHIRHWAQGGPHHALESRLALSRAPPRRSRGGLPARSTARRRAAVPPTGRPACARGPVSSCSTRRSRGSPASAARRGGACPARAERHAGLARGAPGRGLGDRRLAPLGTLVPCPTMDEALDTGRPIAKGQDVDQITPRFARSAICSFV